MNCVKCNNHFEPSSRHKKCPTCRNKDRVKKCPLCGGNMHIYSKSCVKCENKSRTVNPKEKRAGLRIFLGRASKRKRLGNLTIEILEDVWKKQNGTCPYTFVKLELPKYSEVNDRLFTASLDRIDSNLPYTEGNVQFVSILANHAKGTSSHEEMVKFCKILGKNWCTE